MTTREKIIVGLMCLTIIYGAVELLGNRGGNTKRIVKSANPVKELKDFTASVTKKLVDEKVSSEYRYLISQAANDWSKDPFIQSTTPLTKQLAQPTVQKKPTGPKKTHNYVYTGYLTIGTTRLAVINGIEYAEGESLSTNGLFIKSISEKKVVIAQSNGRETIQLSIAESGPTIGNQEP